VQQILAHFNFADKPILVYFIDLVSLFFEQHAFSYFCSHLEYSL